MARRTQRFGHQSVSRPVAILIALADPHQLADQVASSALELARLARGLGIEVVRTVAQSRPDGALTALLNEDRLRELARLTGGPGPHSHSQPPPREERLVDMVLIDGSCTPSQQRTLERALGVEVFDRSALILRVFERRAHSREARLQVELARCLYQAPRIRDLHGLGDREGGGGRGGRGHSNVELRKQDNRERVAVLRRELARIPERAEIRRRRRAELPQIALVGYTNAGKSSWMQALTQSPVLVEDAPFATLDTTVRALTSTRILLSDTVGFIADLPHELVASFRATLEEARHADLLLVVADASDPDLHRQLAVTHETLLRIGAGDVPQQLLLNKADRLSSTRRDALAFSYAGAWLCSAHDAHDVAQVRRRLIARAERAFIEGELFVPHARGALLGELYREAHVLSQRSSPRGTRVALRAAPQAWVRFRRALA
ncbi:MAG TPA: GTPase HflX [Polyangiales bacterium]